MLALVAVALAAPVTLQADPAHSSVSFAVEHMMITTVRGQFDKFTSSLAWDKDNPAQSSVQAKIETASIDTHNDKRDGHLKSADFFDAAKCPEITFKSNHIEKESGNKFKVTGDLTMHCVTRPVTLETEVKGPMKSMTGGNSYGISAAGTLSRKEFGLTWNKAIESGGVAVSDEVKLDLNIEYNEPPASAKAESAAEAKSAAKKDRK